MKESGVRIEHAAEDGSLGRDLRSAAHDIRNLVYRLTFLAENLQRDMPQGQARDEARDLLVDTTDRLTRIADRLRLLSGTEA